MNGYDIIYTDAFIPGIYSLRRHLNRALGFGGGLTLFTRHYMTASKKNILVSALTAWTIESAIFWPIKAQILPQGVSNRGSGGASASPWPGAGDQEGMMGAGRERVFGQRPIGGLTEKIEGCFDRFDSEFAVELGRNNINNKRCQAICTDKGYALSATGLIDSCFCGNDYPSVFHRVDTSLCDLPCSPDKASCFSFTCCGSRDERFFTVSWSGEMDIMKQLLRQLSHDYRFNSPIFRRKIEFDGFCDNVAFRLGPSPVNRENDPATYASNDGAEAGDERVRAWMEPSAPPLYLSKGNGCPVGWCQYDCWCYRQHWADPSTYDEACAKCLAEDAEVATITSEGENRFVQDLYGGCEGWISMKQQVAITHDERTLSALAFSNGSVHLSDMVANIWNEDGDARTQSFPKQAAYLSRLSSTWNFYRTLMNHGSRQLGARKSLKNTLKRAFWDPGAKFHRWKARSRPSLSSESLSSIHLTSFGDRNLAKTSQVGKFYDVRQKVDSLNEKFGNNKAVSNGSHLDFGEVEEFSFTAGNSGLTHIKLGYDKIAFRFLRPGTKLVLSADAHMSISSNLNEITVAFRPEERLVGMKAVFGVWGLRSLSLFTLDSDTNDKFRTYGPFGNLLIDRPGFLTEELWIPASRWHHPVVGFFGSIAKATGYIQSLGMYQRILKDCGWMDESGDWLAVDCYQAPKEVIFFACKKKGWLSKRGCPRGWTPFENSCYLRHRSHNASWWDARAHCQALGGHLGSIKSMAENTFVHALFGRRGGYIGCHRRKSSRPLITQGNRTALVGSNGDESESWAWDAYWNVAGMNSLADTPGKWSTRSISTSMTSTLISDQSNIPKQQCFEMAEDGTWDLVLPSCFTAKTRVVLCEVGANDTSCSCPSPTRSHEEGPGPYHDISDDNTFSLHFGCSCYKRQVVYNVSWAGAQEMCGSWGGRLVVIDSKEENDWVLAQIQDSMTFNYGFLPGYIGLNSMLNGEEYDWSYYENWRHPSSLPNARLVPEHDEPVDNPSMVIEPSVTSEPSMVLDSFACTKMARDGSWVTKPCDDEERANCYVCKKPRAASCPAIRPYEDEQWTVELIDASGHENVMFDENDFSRNPHVNESAGPTSCAYPWCHDCFDIFLKNVNSNQYLCVDDQNHLYLSGDRDRAWCLWTLVMHGDTGAVALLTPHGAGLFYDEESGGLICRFLPPMVDLSLQTHPFKGQFYRRDESASISEPSVLTPPQNPSPWVDSVFAVDDIACFYTSRPIRSIAWRYLRLSIVARSRDLEQPGVKECSIAIYDQTSRSESFQCRRRPMASLGADDLVYLEQEALLFFDQSTFATPRVPLPNGRVRCENQSPTETATCTFAYGQGLTLSRQFRANWGYTISDVVTHRVNANPAQSALFRVPPPAKRQSKQDWQEKHSSHKKFKQREGSDLRRDSDLTLSISELKEFQNAFSVAYNNFYEILVVKSYVETRNWQLSVPVAPRTTDTIQFWLSSENLRYRWRALFTARGGFTITTGGTQIGDHHSLGDLTSFRDLFFFVFGTYEFPYEAEIIITVNDIPGDGWPLPLPEQSQGDRIRDVTRNGQFGFGYGP